VFDPRAAFSVRSRYNLADFVVIGQPASKKVGKEREALLF
jgi:hypothetical protein